MAAQSLPHKPARRNAPIADRLAALSIPEPNSGCVLWLGSANDATGGHGRITIDGRVRPVHRIAWELAHGPIPAGLHVCHTCDVGSCINPSHLFLGTHQTNMADMKFKGRSRGAVGTRNGRAKVTDDMVRAIRADTRTRREIMAEYGLSKAMVGYIRAGTYWKHVD